MDVLWATITCVYCMDVPQPLKSAVTKLDSFSQAPSCPMSWIFLFLSVWVELVPSPQEPAFLFPLSPPQNVVKMQALKCHFDRFKLKYLSPEGADCISDNAWELNWWLDHISSAHQVLFPKLMNTFLLTVCSVISQGAKLPRHKAVVLTIF